MFSVKMDASILVNSVTYRLVVEEAPIFVENMSLNKLQIRLFQLLMKFQNI